MKFNEENLHFLLTLNRLKYGVKEFIKLNQALEKIMPAHFKAEMLFEQQLNIAALFNQYKISKLIKDKINQDKDSQLGADRDLNFANQPDCHIVTRWNQEYPALLKEIRYPPFLLFVKGRVEKLQTTQIAVVGSRNASPKGRETAFSFAEHFSAREYTVTSGLALGCDAAAHQGALKGRGGTIAVLGNGIDQRYPLKNRQLAEQIIENGALLSEFGLGVQPIAYNFPKRNRIISGLSLGTVVVEAALKSGSLITAKFALEQNREVFAVPGSIYSQLAQGCHHLIREGAKLVENPEDVLTELNLSHQFVKKLKGPSLEKSLLSSRLKSVLSGVDDTPTEADKIALRCQLTTNEVSIMLLELEFKGLIKSVPGGFIRC